MAGARFGAALAAAQRVWSLGRAVSSQMQHRALRLGEMEGGGGLWKRVRSGGSRGGGKRERSMQG